MDLIKYTLPSKNFNQTKTFQVSYVLIVQQPEDEKAGGSKSGAQVGGEADDVYDFDGDPDDPNSLGEFITDDKKTKGTGKRSQTVKQIRKNYVLYDWS